MPALDSQPSLSPPLAPLFPSWGCQFNGQVFNSSLSGAWKCQHRCTSVCGVCSSKNSEKLNSALLLSAAHPALSLSHLAHMVAPFLLKFLPPPGQLSSWSLAEKAESRLPEPPVEIAFPRAGCHPLCPWCAIGLLFNY